MSYIGKPTENPGEEDKKKNKIKKIKKKENGILAHAGAVELRDAGRPYNWPSQGSTQSPPQTAKVGRI